jgi:hypothetical protein
MYLPTIGITDISFFARPLFYFLLDYKIEMLDIFSLYLCIAHSFFIVVVYSLFFSAQLKEPVRRFFVHCKFFNATVGGR